MAFPIGLAIAGLTALPQIINAFQKDDPNNPKLNPQQGIQMFMQSLLPIMLLKGDKEGKDNNMFMMFLMMQMMGGGMGMATPALPNPEAMKKQIEDYRASIEAWEAMLGGK